MKKLGLVLAAAALVAYAGNAWATHGGTGNGSPNGSHYNLNIIGVPKEKNGNINITGGHVIFVKLWGSDTKILLCNTDDDGGPCFGMGDFVVLDKDGTDGEASFGLPNPDPANTGSTVYSVFIRGLGNPSGTAYITTCAEDPLDGNVEICSTSTTVEVTGAGGKKSFSNVSKNLLYLYVELDGVDKRIPLFNDRLEDYFWDYDNFGLRLAQLRFYECSTDVPDAGNPGGLIDDSDCFGGDH